MNEFYTARDHFVLMPGLLLGIFGCAVLLMDFLLSRRGTDRVWLIWTALAGEVATGYALWQQQRYLWGGGQVVEAFKTSLVLDSLSLFFNWLFLAATTLVILFSYPYLRDQTQHEDEDHAGEFFGLLLLAQCGMFFLAGGVDLITLFIGLELMAAAFYILVGFQRDDKRSNEAAMKYFLLGAFSSGFLLYGLTLMYGAAGSTKLVQIAGGLSDRGFGDPIVILAMVTVTVGLLFKIAAVPFHMWAPDAYEGAPTPVTAYLSVASKAASFAFLIRIFFGPFVQGRVLWEPVLAVIAIASLTIGNLAAVSQSSLKRLLAYSSISHAGYVLFGVIAGNETGLQGVCVYLLVYTFMNLGAFLVISALRRNGVPCDDLEDFAGLFHRHPGHALWMLLFLVSLAGLPPTAGFIGKYFIFLSLIQTGHYYLAVIGVLYVAVSVYYYFRIVKSMFLGDTEHPAALAVNPGTRVALALSGLATLGIGVWPEPLVRFAQIFGAK